MNGIERKGEYIMNEEFRDNNQTSEQNNAQQNINSQAQNAYIPYGQFSGQNAQNGGWNSYGQQAGQTQYYYQQEQTGQAWQTTNQAQAGQNNSGRQSKHKEKKHRTGLGIGKAIAIALCCSLLGGLIGAGGVILGSRYLDAKEPLKSSVIFQGERPNTAINVANIDTSRQMTPAEIYAVNVNSTVGITTSITTNYWGFQTTTPASGSGFIITEDGYIVTNYHVIEGANSITVTTYDGTAYDAQIIGYDSDNDIAVLKVDAKDLSPVVLGDSDSANVGDEVVTIGNPLGELTFSLASGYISALNRSVTFSTGTTMDLLQLNCAINAGNSGGPLFNVYGEVIGITNAKYSNNGDSSQASIENIGFAIPISHVRSMIESLMEKGYISKPFIGVSISDVSSEAQAYGIPQGAAIVSVEEGYPAEKAGLKSNDVVTAINGQEITSAKELQKIVGAASIGDELVFTVYRQGQTFDLTVSVVEKPVSVSADRQQEERESSQNNGGYGFNFPWGDLFGF